MAYEMIETSKPQAGIQEWVNGGWRGQFLEPQGCSVKNTSQATDICYPNIRSLNLVLTGINVKMLSFSLFFALASLVLALVLGHYYDNWHQSKILEHIPTQVFIDGNNSRERYLSKLKPLLELGYRRYSIHGRVFKVPLTAGGYAVKYRVLLPKDHLEEIKHLSNDRFSWKLASHMIFAGKYTGAPERGPWSGKALRTGIHQNMDYITALLSARIDEFFTRNLPREAGSTFSVNLMSFFVPAVAYVVGAVLLGPELTDDPEWSRRVVEFAVDRYASADDVRKWPPLLAPIVSPLIPSVKRMRDHTAYTHEKMRPLYEDLKARGLLGSEERRKLRKSRFGFEWLWSGAPDDVTLKDFSETVMRDHIASIHTSAKTIAVAFIDLLTHPELLAELREEAREVESKGGISNPDHLFKLDCFLKESQRLSPVFLCK